jgi:Txe/YoeB family toxin of Txe-Axe toxin-antitoxin module
MFTPQAVKDAKKLSEAGLKAKALGVIEILKDNPFQNPLPYEKLVGD